MSGSDPSGPAVHERGFSLIEALVMLVLASLLSLMVLETVRLASSSGLRIQAASRETVAETLDEFALRRMIAGYTVEYLDSPWAFSGSADVMTGYSTQSPGAPGGAPLTLSIVQRAPDWLLVASTPGADEWTIGRFDGRVEFHYFDQAEDRWFETWPPPDTARRSASQPAPFARKAPDAVALDIANTANGLSRRVMVSLPNEATPPARARDFFAVGPAIP